MGTGPKCNDAKMGGSAAYHSQSHWQRTESLRRDFTISALHNAHNLIHITLPPIRPDGLPVRGADYQFSARVSRRCCQPCS